MGCPLKQLPKVFQYIKQLSKQAPKKDPGWWNLSPGEAHEVPGPDLTVIRVTWRDY